VGSTGSHDVRHAEIRGCGLGSLYSPQALGTRNRVFAGFICSAWALVTMKWLSHPKGVGPTLCLVRTFEHCMRWWCPRVSRRGPGLSDISEHVLDRAAAYRLFRMSCALLTRGI